MRTYFRLAAAEPYRILFPLGMLLGCVGVSHWAFLAWGWLEFGSGTYHALTMTGLFMVCFIFGFLMTALPRFSSSQSSTAWEMWSVVSLIVAAAIWGALGHPHVVVIVGVALWGVLAIFGVRRLMQKRKLPVTPPVEFIWITLGVVQGMVGGVLLSLHQPWATAAGMPMVQQGFLLSVVIGVGGFMAPRLLGRAFVTAVPNTLDPLQARKSRMQRLIIYALAALILMGSFLIEGTGEIRLAYGLRALVLTALLGYFVRPYILPSVKDLYVWYVWLSVWFLLIGYLGVTIWPVYRVMWLHVSLLGGVCLMTFAVASMVALSHGGQAERLKKPNAPMVLMGVALIAAMGARVLADGYLVAYYFELLATAAVLWVLAALSWFWMVGPYLGASISARQMEIQHEQAKARAAAQAQKFRL